MDKKTEIKINMDRFVPETIALGIHTTFLDLLIGGTGYKMCMFCHKADIKSEITL